MRQDETTRNWIPEEQVLGHYHGNAEKAKDAIEAATKAGRNSAKSRNYAKNCHPADI